VKELSYCTSKHFTIRGHYPSPIGERLYATKPQLITKLTIREEKKSEREIMVTNEWLHPSTLHFPNGFFQYRASLPKLLDKNQAEVPSGVAEQILVMLTWII